MPFSVALYFKITDGTIEITLSRPGQHELVLVLGDTETEMSRASARETTAQLE
jgi:hypothetical protein